MTERDALLAAVCAAPDDDLPRLVFADWCDENGAADRAEFIRVQIELEKGVKGKKLTALRKREQELLTGYGAEWASDLKEFDCAVEDRWYTFRRGFVDEISTSYDQLHGRRGDKLFHRAPIRALRLPDEEDFSDLARCKHLLRVHTLNLTYSGLSRNFDFMMLPYSKYVANLTSLIARGIDDNGHLDGEGLQAIATSPHLTALRHLDISNNWLFNVRTHYERDRIIRHLLALGDLPALTDLRLGHIEAPPDLILSLAEQPWLRRLKVLDLSGNRVANEGARALTESPHLTQIEQLDLRNLGLIDLETGADLRLSPEVKQLLKQRFGERVLLDE